MIRPASLPTTRKFLHKNAVQTVDKLELDVKLLPMSINLQMIAEMAKAINKPADKMASLQATRTGNRVFVERYAKFITEKAVFL